jgi:hypothetical protein
MLKKKKVGIGIACALALGICSGAALATPVTVGGVTFDPSSPLNMTIQALNFRESSVTKVGDVLHGYGEIGSINGTSPSTFCKGCDLNFTFHYRVSSINKTTSGGTTIHQVAFNDGQIDFYRDDSQGFSVTDPSSAGAGTGPLWLSLAGHTAPRSGFIDSNGQLYSTINGTVNNPTSGSAGFGLLDVTGGLADGQYTNTNIIADGIGGFADFSLDSSFQTQDAGICQNGICYPISGTGQLIGDQAAAVGVPEPGELGLLGLGLAALGFFTWRRRKEARGRA